MTIDLWRERVQGRKIGRRERRQECITTVLWRERRQEWMSGWLLTCGDEGGV